MAVGHPCISCSKEVRPQQHGIECDICTLWQHRTCNTGITQQQYRQAVKGLINITWTCIPCRDNNIPGKSQISLYLL